jgi:hypothetical protein
MLQESSPARTWHSAHRQDVQQLSIFRSRRNLGCGVDAMTEIAGSRPQGMSEELTDHTIQANPSDEEFNANNALYEWHD